MGEIKISISIEIQQKPPTMEGENRKISTTQDVYNLQEIQEIKNAIQEHLIFIGLDCRNNIRNINLIGIGASSEIKIDLKEIVRLALFNASDKVILAHNHPSNVLTPSRGDIQITNTVGVYLKSFNINLLDHVIVGNDNYLSMGKEKHIDLDYKDQRIYAMRYTLLEGENSNLKKEIEELKTRLNEQENQIDDEMEF